MTTLKLNPLFVHPLPGFLTFRPVMLCYLDLSVWEFSKECSPGNHVGFLDSPTSHVILFWLQRRKVFRKTISGVFFQNPSLLTSKCLATTGSWQTKNRVTIWWEVESSKSHIRCAHKNPTTVTFSDKPFITKSNCMLDIEIRSVQILP